MKIMIGMVIGGIIGAAGVFGWLAWYFRDVMR